MKNSLKVSLLAVLFTVGIGGAVVEKIHAAPKRAAATYQWLKFNHNGTRNPSLDEDATIADAQSDYGCSGAVTVCATGTKDAGSGDGPDAATLRFSN
jgi:hypothetical protein